MADPYAERFGPPADGKRKLLPEASAGINRLRQTGSSGIGPGRWGYAFDSRC